MRRPGGLALAAALAATLWGAGTPAAAQTGARDAMDDATHIARGAFAPTLTPAAAPARGLGAMAIAKVYTGDLDATATGLMLSAGAPQAGEAGYVAMEMVDGTLAGRHGGFALQQSGTMDAGGQTMSVVVVPGSGTGALTGIAGTMDITIAADGRHAYVLHYRLAR